SDCWPVAEMLDVHVGKRTSTAYCDGRGATLWLWPRACDQESGDGDGYNRLMGTLESHVDPASADFQANFAHQRALAQTLRERLEQVRQGGGSQAVARHRRRGKLTARERIERLCDPHTPFLELSPLAAWDMYDGEAPSAGVVTGIGLVHGLEVAIV